MNASKRKFNALLNSFGSKSASTTSPSSSAVNNGSLIELIPESSGDSQMKRRRILRPLSAFPQSHSNSITTISPSTKAKDMGHSKSISLSTSDATAADTAKYSPWDRAAFLKRLSSFKSVTDWTPKPGKVNEVEWAKRGWVCQGHERVRCEFCSVEILVKLNVQEIEGEQKMVLNAADIEQALVDRYAELIITSHAESCLWRQRGCDDMIFKLPLNHSPTTFHALRVRYDALCNIGDRLPYICNIHPPENFDLDVNIDYLPKSFFASHTPSTEAPIISAPVEINRVAFLMALFGWTAPLDNKFRNGAAVCEACFRTLGLWLFKSKEVNEAGEVVQAASMNYLDPIEEHRDYCPWRNPRSQSGGGKGTKSVPSPELAAWQIIIRVLKNDHLLRQAGQVDKDKKQSSTAESASRPSTSFTADVEDEDAKSVRDGKDKERWARLRRVRSLFEIKPAKKLQRDSAVPHGKAKT